MHNRAVVVTSLDQRVRQIEMRDRVIGRCGYGAFIFLYRTFLVTLLTKQQSEIEMSFRIILLDVDRLLVFGDGAGGVTPVRQQDGVAIVGLGVGRVQTDSFFVVSFRSDRVALLLQINRDLEMLEGFRVSRLCRRELHQHERENNRDDEDSSYWQVHIYTVPFHRTALPAAQSRPRRAG